MGTVMPRLKERLELAAERLIGKRDAAALLRSFDGAHVPHRLLIRRLKLRCTTSALSHLRKELEMKPRCKPATRIADRIKDRHGLTPSEFAKKNSTRSYTEMAKELKCNIATIRRLMITELARLNLTSQK